MYQNMLSKKFPQILVYYIHCSLHIAYDLTIPTGTNIKVERYWALKFFLEQKQTRYCLAFEFCTNRTDCRIIRLLENDLQLTT